MGQFNLKLIEMDQRNEDLKQELTRFIKRNYPNQEQDKPSSMDIVAILQTWPIVIIGSTTKTVGLFLQNPEILDQEVLVWEPDFTSRDWLEGGMRHLAEEYLKRQQKPTS